MWSNLDFKAKSHLQQDYIALTLLAETLELFRD